MENFSLGLKRNIKIGSWIIGILAISISVLVITALFRTHPGFFFFSIDLLGSIAGIWIGFELIYAALITKINVMGSKINFRTVFFSIDCEWDQLDRLWYTDKEFRLLFTSSVSSKKIFLDKLFLDCDRKGIPLFLFMDSWNENKDWEKNKILLWLGTLSPSLQEKVLTDLKK